MLDMNGDVEDLDVKQNIKALTHLIQLVRYAYKKTDNLKSLLKGYSQRFTLYCGQAQRPLSPDHTLFLSLLNRVQSTPALHSFFHLPIMNFPLNPVPK